MLTEEVFRPPIKTFSTISLLRLYSLHVHNLKAPFDRTKLHTERNSLPASLNDEGESPFPTIRLPFVTESLFLTEMMVAILRVSYSRVAHVPQILTPQKD